MYLWTYTVGKQNFNVEKKKFNVTGILNLISQLMILCTYFKQFKI